MPFGLTEAIALPAEGVSPTLSCLQKNRVYRRSVAVYWSYGEGGDSSGSFVSCTLNLIAEAYLAVSCYF